MKTVMILGAGPYQVPAIKIIKELGYKAIVCDYNSTAIGVPFADVFYEVSTIDRNAVLEKALEIKPDFIITSTSDMPVRTAAYVAEKMNLPKDLSYEDSICATDKSAMRERLKAFGVPIPKFFICHTFVEFRESIEALKYLCVVKPADNAASRGVKLIDKELYLNELEQLYLSTKCYSRNGIVMVEEFMTGPEVSVESFIVDGKVEIITLTDKLVSPLPFFVELGHSEPSQLSDSVQKQIKIVTTKAINAIGIQNGVSHAELKVTKDGPKIVEIAARLGGDYITAKLVPYSTGIDMVKNSLLLALRKEIHLQKSLNYGSAIRFITAKKGTIRKITFERNPLDMEGVRDFQLNANVGGIVPELKSSNDRLGFVITQAQTPQKAIEIAQKALELVKIDIVP